MRARSSPKSMGNSQRAPTPVPNKTPNAVTSLDLSLLAEFLVGTPDGVGSAAMPKTTFVPHFSSRSCLLDTCSGNAPLVALGQLRKRAFEAPFNCSRGYMLSCSSLCHWGSDISLYHFWS